MVSSLEDTQLAAVDKTEQVLFTMNTHYLSSYMQWLESMQLEMWILLSWLLSCNLFMFISFLCSFYLLRIDLHTIPEVLKLGGWVDLLILSCMFKLRAFCSLFPTQFHLLLYPQLFYLSTPTVCYLSLFLSPHSSHF